MLPVFDIPVRDKKLLKAVKSLTGQILHPASPAPAPATCHVTAFLFLMLSEDGPYRAKPRVVFAEVESCSTTERFGSLFVTFSESLSWTAYENVYKEYFIGKYTLRSFKIVNDTTVQGALQRTFSRLMGFYYSWFCFNGGLNYLYLTIVHGSKIKWCVLIFLVVAIVSLAPT